MVLRDSSKAVLLLQFFFVCVTVVSYVACVLSLFVPNFSFLLCLGKAVLRDCVHFRPIFIYMFVPYLPLLLMLRQGGCVSQ